MDQNLLNDLSCDHEQYMYGVSQGTFPICLSYCHFFISQQQKLSLVLLKRYLLKKRTCCHLLKQRKYVQTPSSKNIRTLSPCTWRKANNINSKKNSQLFLSWSLQRFPLPKSVLKGASGPGKSFFLDPQNLV